MLLELEVLGPAQPVAAVVATPARAAEPTPAAGTSTGNQAEPAPAASKVAAIADAKQSKSAENVRVPAEWLDELMDRVGEACDCTVAPQPAGGHSVAICSCEQCQ